jgi:hypothetical protein
MRAAVGLSTWFGAAECSRNSRTILPGPDYYKPAFYWPARHFSKNTPASQLAVNNSAPFLWVNYRQRASTEE